MRRSGARVDRRRPALFRDDILASPSGSHSLSRIISFASLETFHPLVFWPMRPLVVDRAVPSDFYIGYI